MNISTQQYSCPSCGATFAFPGLPDSAYGEFVLWSKSGQHAAYLNAFDDGAFRCLGESLRSLGVPDMRRADLQQRLYGELICDPSPDGSRYQLGGFPACPCCGNQDGLVWEPSDGTATINVASHVYWDQLSEEEKQARIRAAVS